ncbi:MAG: hypothetical protein AAGG51_21350 [Cyanobacteria bacterium P01_G01_bin.54]
MAKDKRLKFNPFVLGSVGLFTLIVLGFSAWRLFLGFTRAQRAQEAARSTSLAHPQFQLGALEAIPGTAQVMIPLHAIPSADRPSYEKSPQTTHNYLFVNSQTNLENWLLDTNDALITASFVLSASAPDTTSIQAAGIQTAGILYEVVQADTDADQQLTSQDQKVLALSRPDGKGYRVVIEAVETVIGHQLTEDNTILVIYEQEDTIHSVNIDLDNFRVVEEAEAADEGSDRQQM